MKHGKIEHRQSELEAIFHKYIQPQKPVKPSAPTHDGKNTRLLLQDDAALLEKVFRAKNGADFKALWGGDTSGYLSSSEADLALCCHLAFWTNKDAPRIERLMRQSGLVRAKWDRGDDYLQRTISRAIELTTETYTGTGQTFAQIIIADSTKQPEGDNLGPLHRYRYTDQGNAQAFCDAYGHCVRYVAAWKSWLIYNGKFWEFDEKGLVIEYLKQLNEARFAQALALDEADRNALLKHAMVSSSANRIVAAATLAQSDPRIAARPSDFDTHPLLLNTQSGTVDLTTGELMPHNPKDMLTRITRAAYNPNIKSKRWNRFISEVTGDEATGRYKQMVYGYSCTGLTNEQIFFILYGTGANGKSTEVNTIHYVLGDAAPQSGPPGYAHTAHFDTFIQDNRGYQGTNEGVANLRGVRFTSALESESTQRLNEGLVKQITGGDMLVASKKYQHEFSFKPEFKLFLASNHKPVIRGTDFGIWRRVHLLPYEMRFDGAKRNNRLQEELKAEADGILTWLVVGAVAWHRQGLKMPKHIENATSVYKTEMDSLNDFISEYCYTGGNYMQDLTRLYKAYRMFSVDNEDLPMGKRSFIQALEERGHKLNVGRSRQRLILGLALKDGAMG